MSLENISTSCTRTEFVGTAVLDTIGLVIPGIDHTLLQKMNIGTKYRSLGLFSSRTGAALQLTALDDAVKAQAFSFMAASPAAIGLVAADNVMKAAPVEIVNYMTPTIGTSHTNEVILAFSGDAGSVKTSVLEAREVSCELLSTMGSFPNSMVTPFF